MNHQMKTQYKKHLAVICATLMAALSLQAADKLKALIIDGQNNHDWKACTPILKWILEDCGRFTVDVSTTPSAGNPPKAPRGQLTAEQKTAQAAALAKYKADQAERWKQWRPKFSD